MTSFRSSILALLVSSLASISRGEDPLRCDVDGYYYDRLGKETHNWSRENVVEILQFTHRADITPFFSSDPGNGDVLEALLELDPDTGFDGFSSNSMIHLLYLNQNAPQFPLDRSIWVPEHIAPILMTSVGAYEFDAAFSDLHNIRPVHPDLHESSRGTYYFGVCPVCNDLIQSNSDVCICGDFFQPPPASRGIVARSLLYMQLRYSDLKFSNCHLEQLLAWHVEYPPTPQERLRNLHICYEWQGNRNPYVDFPELAWQMDLDESECLGADWGDVQPAEDNLFDREDDTETDTADPCVQTSSARNNRWRPPANRCSPNNGVSDQVSNEIADKEYFEERVDEMVLDNFLRPESPQIDHCASLLSGDIYFYVIQATPTRMGMLPLIDLPRGLDLYLSDTLTFSNPANPRANIRVANDVPDPPLLKLSLDREMASGNPFGYGRNLLLGDDWEVITGPITIRGDAFGGDELFVFCVEANEEVRLLSAITTNGSFRDDKTNQVLLNEGYGKIILPFPMDYYVYNGPHYYRNEAYQMAFMDPSNWLGFAQPNALVNIDSSMTDGNGEPRQGDGGSDTTSSGRIRTLPSWGMICSTMVIWVTSVTIQ